MGEIRVRRKRIRRKFKGNRRRKQQFEELVTPVWAALTFVLLWCLALLIPPFGIVASPFLLIGSMAILIYWLDGRTRS